MTTAGPERPLTAADLLFGSSADASQALTREIMSASRGQNLGSALKHLPRVTREAAAREATAAAAGLMKIDLIDVLAAGWREQRDIVSAARRTLATPGSKELVGVAAHRITTLQQPAVSVLIDGRRVHTLQLGLSIVFEVTGLVAGISLGRLAGIHAGRAQVGVALTVHEIEVLTKRGYHIELPGAMALKAGFRLLPGNEYPSGEYQGSGATGAGPGSNFPGRQFPSVEFAGSEFTRSEFASTDYASTEHTGTEHTGTEHTGSEHAGSEVGGEHPGSLHQDGEHPGVGEGGVHPSSPAPAASGQAPWWEDLEAAPPPSRSQ
jgi:hypothetical protein